MCVVTEKVIDGKNYVSHKEYEQLFDRANRIAVENESLNKRVDMLTKENAEMAKQLDYSIELPDCRPITVARALITMKRTFDETGIYGHGFDKRELRQIAEHLLVYCNAEDKRREGHENESDC